MNICILSMQRVQNFGSLLQSYALKRMLEKLECSVSFIDIEPNHQDNSLLEGCSGMGYQEGEESGSFLAKLKKIDRYTWNRIRIRYLSSRQNIQFGKFRAAYLELNQQKRECYDLCVIGSDEVFNCLSGAAWGFTGQLYGDVSQAKRVITYAACCGSTIAERLPIAAANRISDAFQNISSFSVRDKNTAEFVLQLAKRHPEEHLDPAAVMDFSEELASAKLPQECSARYCVIYSYYNRISNPEEIRQIRHFCKQHDLRMIAAGAPQKWIKDYLVLTPFELLKVFAHADFVVTDTFHGAVFSVKYAKRFAIRVRDSNRNKLDDFIDRLNIQQHKIESFSYLEKAYAAEKQQDRLAAVLLQEREKTMRYLQKNLYGEEI